MKRLNALLITLSMIALSISAFAGEGDAPAFEQDLDFLSKIGVVAAGDSIASKRAADEVTRGEFAMLASRAYLRTAQPSGRAYFSDISPEQMEYDAVNALAEAGILHGIGAGRFESRAAIKFYDAADIMLRIMGYKSYDGTTGAAFVTDTCTRYHLLSRADLNNTGSDAANIIGMFRKLLEGRVMHITSAGELRGESYASYHPADDTMLSLYFDIYKLEGVLESNGIVSVFNNAAPDGSRIVVDGLSMKITALPDIIAGTPVTAYYQNKDAPELRAIYTGRRVTMERLRVEASVSYSNFAYEYEAEGAKKNARFHPADTVIIYNNELLKVFDEPYILPPYGVITLIGKDTGAIAQVIDIKSYVSFTVESVFANGDDTILRGRGSALFSATVGKDVPCAVKDSGGRAIGLGDIKSGDVISVAAVERGNKKYAREIIASRKTVSGTISEVQSGSGGALTRVMIGDEGYWVCPSDPEFSSRLKPSAAASVFLLDFLGNIVDIRLAGYGGQTAVGYLVGAAQKSGSLSASAQLKIFDELERLKIYQAAQNTMIDGISYRDSNAIVQAVGAHLDELILFRVNDSGEVNYIDTAADYTAELLVSGNNYLVKMGSDKDANSNRGLYFMQSTGSFSNRVIVSPDAIVISVPENTADARENEFALLPYHRLAAHQYYNVQGYSIDKGGPFCDFVVVRRNGKDIGGKQAAVIVSISDAIDENGELTKRVHLYDQTGSHSYLVKDQRLLTQAMRDIAMVDKTGYEVQAGDVVRYSLGADDKIDQLLLCYDYSADALLTGHVLDPSSFSASSRVAAGFGYSVCGGYLKAVDVLTDMGTLKPNSFEYLNLDKFKKIVVIEQRGTKRIVREGGAQDIRTYLDYGENCSKLIVNCADMVEGMLFIYQGGENR